MLAKDFGGTSDPYAKIFLDGEAKAKTQTVNKTLNPKWNEVFALPYVANNRLSKMIRVILYDNDYGKSDDVLGQIDINVSQLKRYTDQTTPEAEWVPLEAHKNRAKVRGDVKVIAWIGQ